MPEIFHVGAKALIARDDKALLLNLRPGDPNWEMPGGRLDSHESIKDALTRQLSEELPGSDLREVGELLYAHRVPGRVFGDAALCLLYYETDLVLPDNIELPRHYAYRWQSLQQLSAGVTPGAAGAIGAYLRRREA